MNNKPPTRDSIRIRLGILIWKGYVQRRRRWKMYLCQCIIAIVCYVCAIVLSSPTFRNLIVPKYEAEHIHNLNNLKDMIPENISLAYTPSNEIFDTIMNEVTILLEQKFDHAANQSELLNDLYRKIKANSTKPLIWIIWNDDMKDFPYIWKYTIRRSAIKEDDSYSPETYFSSGFLGVQVAINTAIVNYAKTVSNEPFEVLIQEMPQTNLMYVSKVRETSCMILFFATCALLPFALETQALAIRETRQKLKKYLLVYNLSYYEIYLGWILYGVMSGFPVCILGMLSILFIFRWTGLIITFLFIFMYFVTMLVGTCLVSCFHKKELVSTIHNVCIVIFMCVLSMIMLSDSYDRRIKYIIGLMHLLIPSLTFVHGLDRFAFSHVEFGLLSHGIFTKLEWFIFSWIFTSVVYFLMIVYLQYTLDQGVRGSSPWHFIFKWKEDNKKIMPSLPSISDHVETRNEVHGLALSFRQISKITRDDVLLKNVSFDIYRGEYTILTSYETEYKSLDAIISLIIGISQPDNGVINILGMDITDGNNIVTQELGYVGYCPLPQTLMPDLTVEEHMTFLLELCTVIKTSAFKWNYISWRVDSMLNENPTLKEKRNILVRNLNVEECAHLCWTMATITDPRIIIIHFTNELLPENFKTVIYRKIKKNIGKRTIIQTSTCLSHSEYANRCLMFNRGYLVCAGTPTYLLSVYGKSYTLSVKLTNLGVESDIHGLVQQHVPGSWLCYKIARMMEFTIPLFPTEPITCICKLFDKNMEKLHIDFYDLLLPSMDEVHKRALHLFQKHFNVADAGRSQNMKTTLQTAVHNDQTNLHKRYKNLSVMWKKYRRFVDYYRFTWCLFIATAILFAIYFSLSIETKLNSNSVTSFEANRGIDADLLTVEAMKRRTTFVVRSDKDPKAVKVAHAYTFSEPDLTEDDVQSLRYVKLHANEALPPVFTKDHSTFNKEGYTYTKHLGLYRHYLTMVCILILLTMSMDMYLILQAISEPFRFITNFAYGLDISYNEKLSLRVYYSTLHTDYAAVSRSIGRAFMALLRFQTNTAYATIQVTDEPLSFDLSSKDPTVSSAPFVLSLLLTVVVSYVTILPSLENGRIRITQVNTANFSLIGYWSILFLFDFTIYCAMVVLIMFVAKLILSVTVPLFEVELDGLFVLLITYGFAAIPHAYLFSYFATGLMSAVNYVFANVVFYEIILILFTFAHDHFINLLYLLMSFSPLCSFAFAYTEIKKVIINNNQCESFHKHNKCKSGFFHACCPNTCGVFQRCFTPQYSLRFKSEESPGIMEEVIFIVFIGVLYSITLLLIEYDVLNKIISYIFANFVYPGYKVFHDEDESVRRETQHVEDTWSDLKSGIGFAVKDVYKKEHNSFQSVGGISFTVKTGEIMTILGQKGHGRGRLLQLLTGNGCFTKGDAHILQQEMIPITSVKYAKCIGYSTSELSCPPWLTVHEGLTMIGLLRGIDIDDIYQQVNKWLSVLDLNNVSKLCANKLMKTQVIRLNLAMAMIAEPQILILDDPTHMQTRAKALDIYTILEELQTKGHSIIVGSNRMERTIPISQKFAVISHGHFKVSDLFTNMKLVHSSGYTVILHFKEENLVILQTDLTKILTNYFKDIKINYLQRNIGNIQISDKWITWGQVFENLDKIKASFKAIDNYVVQNMSWHSIYIKIIGDDYKEPVVSIKPYWRRTKKKKLIKCESDIMSVPLPSNLPFHAYFDDA